MLWLIYALFAAAAFGISTIADKIAVTKFFRSPWSYYGWWVAYSIFLAPLFLIFAQGPVSVNGYAIIAGMISALSSVVYLSAMGKEDATRVISLVFVGPIFVAIFSAAFLGEFLSQQDYIGIIVLVLGTTMMGIKEPRKMTLTRGAQLALLVAFLYSLSTLTYKAATGVSDPFVAIFWEWLAYGVFGAVIAHSYLGKFGKEFPRLGIGRIGFLFAVAGIVAVGYTALTYAYVLQSAALVSAVSSAQPLFVVFYALFATVAVPKLMKEELGRRTMAFKVLGGLLIILGVYLVS